MATIRISQIRQGGSGSQDISLIGPVSGSAGDTLTYSISDYDVFSVYTVASSVGTATRTDDEITVTVPAGTAQGTVNLVVTRNGNARTFPIAIGGASVRTPTILSPTNGSSSVSPTLTIQASQFESSPVGADAATSSTFQIATDSGFANIVEEITLTSGDLSKYSPQSLQRGVTYFARMKYSGAALGDSSWSQPVSFSTATTSIAKPTLTFAGDANNATETPTFTGSAFSVTPAGADSHASSTWVLKQGEVEVWRQTSSTNKVNLVLPAGILSTSSVYTMEVRYNGGEVNSVFSDKLTFTTKSSFVPDIPGTPYGGGYYVGKVQQDDGVYALIVSPKSAQSGFTFGPGRQPTAGITSDRDGYANSLKMVSDAATFAAAEYCRAYSGGGHADWYMPAKNELEILYRNLKPLTIQNMTGIGANPDSLPPGSSYTLVSPAQTASAAFKSGGTEAFDTNKAYTSSTVPNGSPHLSFGQSFYNGEQGAYNQSTMYFVRPVRRVKISN